MYAVFWWGGFVRTDHFGDPEDNLAAVLVEYVFAQLGRYVRGAIDAVTTLRAFGFVENPISVFLLWADGACRRRNSNAFLDNFYKTLDRESMPRCSKSPICRGASARSIASMLPAQ